VLLEGFVDALWADPVADRTSEIGQALLAFLADASRDDPIAPLEAGDEQGEVAGIFYRAQGSGPPLVLFPLNLAPSQWEPLLPLLSQRYRTITLGGAYLWGVAQLEQRMRSGYGSVVRSVVETCALQRGERVLDVGCGSGAAARWLARQTRGANPIIGVDLNPYLLREAADLAAAEGVGDFIQFQEGNAEALPFPVDSFDVTLACTVLEEGDADRMLAELVRVTKPGGRVGVVVRAEDVPAWDSLELPAEIRTRAGSGTGYGAAAGGCADTSLYRRVRALGLDDLTMGPQLGIVSADPQLESVLSNFESSQLAGLNVEDAQTWRAIAAQAMEMGTYLWAYPFHCAVGTKPL
jgi:SAM-dependent methyltransferase